MGADRRHRDRMRAVGRIALPARAIEPVEHPPGQHDCASCGATRAEALAHRDQIGPGLAMLELEPPADPAEAGHGLVRYPVRSFFRCQPGYPVLVVRRVVDAALAVVEEDGGTVCQLCPGGREPVRSRGRVRLPGDACADWRGQLVHGRKPGRSGAARPGPGQPAMPLRLHCQLPGKPGAAVVGTLPGREFLPAGQRLAQRKRSVVGLAGADEEADRAGPVLTRECDAQQVLCRLLALRPLPALVDDWCVRRAPDRLDDLGVTVPERRRRVAGVDDLAAVGQPEPGAVTADDPGVSGVARGQARRQEATAGTHDSGLPPMPHCCAGTPSTTTQMFGRESSPKTSQAASVSAAMSRSLTAGSRNRRSTAFTSMYGITHLARSGCGAAKPRYACSRVASSSRSAESHVPLGTFPYSRQKRSACAW